ncbi:hypothetical protein TWF281_008962 [Arthrobotrys megalospora]
MASLTLISKIPEILFLILEYLPQRAVFYLLQTCISLYPACQRHIWTTVTLDGYDSYARLLCFAGCLRILGPDTSAIKYIKTLVLGRTVFGRAGSNDASPEELGAIAALQQLIGSNKLDLRRAEIIFRNYHDPQLGRLQEDLLLSLKEYAKSKTLEAFSIDVFQGTVDQVRRLFRLDAIAKLGLTPKNRVFNKPMGLEISELAALLFHLPNLKFFSWKRAMKPVTRDNFALPVAPGDYPDSEAMLQEAFSGLGKLLELQFNCHLFGPSFFIIPPKNLRKLVLGAEMSDAWWHQFARCDIPSLEELEIKIREDIKYHHLSYNFTLGDVSISGLKRLSISCDSTLIPIDIRECVARRNKGYLPQYYMENAEQQAKIIMMKNKPRITDHARSTAFAVRNRYTLQAVAEPKANHKRNFAREYASSFMDSFAGTNDLSNWITAQERASRIRKKVQEDLQNTIQQAMERMEHAYMAKLAQDLGREDDDGQLEEKFRAEYLQMLVDWPTLGFREAVENWEGAKCALDELALLCDWEFRNDDDDFGQGGRELCKRRTKVNDTTRRKIANAIMTSSEQDIDNMITEWAQERVKLLEPLFYQHNFNSPLLRDEGQKERS